MKKTVLIAAVLMLFAALAVSCGTDSSETGKEIATTVGTTAVNTVLTTAVNPTVTTAVTIAVTTAIVTTVTTAVDYTDGDSDGYGVFLSCDPESLPDVSGYKTIVIDMDYFTREQVTQLKTKCNRVFSYLNVGSLENFRDYYDDYRSLALGEYENWIEEVWIDVSRPEWQEHISRLAAEYIEKGADGFYLYNFDVCYYFPAEKNSEALLKIARGLKYTGAYCMMNGGDAFFDYCVEKNVAVGDILDAVNQETVFSAIDFESNALDRADAEEHGYFTGYVESALAHGLDIYLLEYTTDKALKKEIRDYCEQKGFGYYISDSVELD